MINFTIDELKQQIIDVILPSSKADTDVDSLLETFLCSDTAVIETSELSPVEDNMKVGTVGLWSGPLNEKKIGVKIDRDVLQLYKKARFGLVPAGEPVQSHTQTLKEEVENYSYEERNSRIFLVF